jgi:hypothetical protein
MGLFDDSSLLKDRNFSWGLASYTESVDLDSIDPTDPSTFPPDAEKIAVFIDLDGVANFDAPLMSYIPRDPINAAVEQTYSKDNLFIDGLEKALNTVPIYTTILYPAYNPIVNRGDSVFDRKGHAAPSGGWVPCAGQTLIYDDNSRLEVPSLISASVTSGAGDGQTTTTKYFAPPGMVYLIKVPEGWQRATRSQFIFGGSEVDFDMNLNDLSKFAAPAVGIGLFF